MADIKNWAAMLRGRWDWTRFGYEKGLHGCQFTDLDAAMERLGSRLVIEAKHYDGVGTLPGQGWPPGVETGQLLFLRDEVRLGKTVIVLYGCGVCDDPYVIYVLGTCRAEDRREDWRGEAKEKRRSHLKAEIDCAMGLSATQGDRTR